MKQVISVIQPFAFQQRIYMFEDGHLIMDISATLDNLPERLVKVCLADDVTDLTLQGSIDFTAKIKERIRDYEITNYGEKKLEVNLVS